MPEESVSLSWQEPKTERKVIERIPEDHIEYTDIPFIGVDTEPVYRDVPIRDREGNIVMIEKDEEFRDHGKPAVKWETRNIVGNQRVTRYETMRVPLTTSETIIDSDGNMHTISKVYAYNLSYTPIVDGDVIGKCKVPDVTFNHGVKTGKIMLQYTLGGALIGALAGAVAGPFLPVFTMG